jgi:hypothetical protein
MIPVSSHSDSDVTEFSIERYISLATIDSPGDAADGMNSMESRVR